MTRETLRDLLPEKILKLSRRLRGLEHISLDKNTQPTVDMPLTGIYYCERDSYKWRLPMISAVAQGVAHSNWEPELTQWIKINICQGMTVMDVGANFGAFTLLLSSQVGEEGHVLAFEPVLYWREMLTWHIDHNKCENVSVFDFGLSDNECVLPITISEGSATLHEYDGISRTTEDIKLHKLDDVIDPQISRLDFIKIDVDGHEPAFLRGAKITLNKFRPIIALEFSPHYLDKSQSSAWEQKILLDELNYEIRSESGLVFDDIEFGKEIERAYKGFNAMAFPL